MDGLFLNQKANKNIPISYSLKYKHSKKNSLQKNKDEINIPWSSINQNPNSSMSVMLCTGATFVKKDSCLVTRTVSFDTVGLHLLTYFLYFRAVPVQRYSHINGIIIVPFKSYLNQCFQVSQLLKYDGNVVVT